MDVTPDVAGIYRALGDLDRARTVRVAKAMQSGHRYAAIAWPRRGRGRRTRQRAGRDWRTQPRAEGGQWAPFEEAA